MAGDKEPWIEKANFSCRSGPTTSSAAQGTGSVTAMTTTLLVSELSNTV
jgi:hypothetical protein